MADTHDPRQQSEGLTRQLAERVAAFEYKDLPDDVARLARQCFLDWAGITMAGSNEELVAILERVLDEGGDSNKPRATFVGDGRQLSPMDAALLNGAASHALDYDDVNNAMMGHPTVPIVAGLLALAEREDASGADFLNAFVAGYETECRIGAAMGGSHYAGGWHATATIGTFGAAAACSRLLGLDAERTAHAFGIAGSSAAGLKSMFGSMTKPLQAGRASQNGLMAALLAAEGFTANPEVLESPQGFADTQSSTFNPEAALMEPKGGYHIRNNLFKYHAACYLTHSSIEATQQLVAAHDIAPVDVDQVTVTVPAGHLSVCNIEEPASGLETKFSLRMTTAFALAGLDTSALQTYSDENARQPELVALRDHVRIETLPEGEHVSRVRIETSNDSAYDGSVNMNIPASDLDAQEERLLEKFISLAAPHIGGAVAETFAGRLQALEEESSMAFIQEFAERRNTN